MTSKVIQALSDLIEICRAKCSPTDEVLLSSGKTNHQALVEAVEALKAADDPVWIVVHVAGGIPHAAWAFAGPVEETGEKATTKAKAIVQSPEYEDQNDAVQVFLVRRGECEPQLMNLVIDEWLAEAGVNQD